MNEIMNEIMNEVMSGFVKCFVKLNTVSRYLTVFAIALTGAGAILSQSPAGAAKMVTITLHAAHGAYQNCPVSVVLAPSALSGLHVDATGTTVMLVPTDGSPHIPAQATLTDGKAQLTFLVADLPQGATRSYQLQPASAKANATPDAPHVTVRAHGDDLDVLLGKHETLFTRYTTHSGPNKPFFYPILTPDGQPMTRRWPLEADTQESHDHPHHRGLWFTHGDINGVDFWTEVADGKNKVGKTIAKGFENLTSGPVFGGFRTHTEWRGPDDHLMATDVRDVRVYEIGGDHLLDFEITIKPAGEPLVWGDTKEGMFGLRVPDALAPNPDKAAHIAPPTGHIESGNGLKDAAVWGKPNTWIDYYGPIGGKTYGVAIFDNNQNLRHPQTWHARDYGLFAVNPFGLHDFKLGEKGAGNFTQPADKPFTLRYRLLFHAGDTGTAHVADQYRNYSDPPEVTIK